MEIGAPPDPSGMRLAADTTDDPALVTSQTGAFFGPRDVVAANGEIYVVDTGNERIQVFGPDGEFRRVWGGYGSGPDRLIEPVGIAVDEAGIIYVADSGNARISLFTPEGEPVTQWPVAAWPAPDPAGIRPAFQPYLAFDADGNLYATSADTGSVEMLDPDGQLVEAIQTAGGNRLQRPTGIGVAPNGDVLITDTLANAVFRYSPPVMPPLSDIEVLIPALEDASPEAVTDELDAAAGSDAAGSPVADAGSPVAGNADSDDSASGDSVPDSPDPGDQGSGGASSGSTDASDAPPTSQSIPPPPGLGS
jgi:streptogramin lyase